MRRLLLVPGLALVALAASIAPSAAAPRLEPAAREVGTGQQVEFRWHGLGPADEEVELELSLGGSRWVRISPELEPLEGRFVWTVPAGIAGPARIRLRAGGERGEREVAECSLFVRAEAAPRPHVARAMPGWWDLEPEHGAASGWSATSHPGLSAGRGSLAAIAASTMDTGARSQALRAHASRSAFVRPGAGCTRTFLPPRLSPLRI